MSKKKDKFVILNEWDGLEYDEVFRSEKEAHDTAYDMVQECLDSKITVYKLVPVVQLEYSGVTTKKF